MTCQRVVRFEFLTAVLVMMQVFLDIMPCRLVKWCKRMRFTMLTDKLLAWSSYEQKEFPFCLTDSILLTFLFDMLPYCYLSVSYRNCVLMRHDIQEQIKASTMLDI